MGGILAGLKNITLDIASLEVVTYTGKIKVDADTAKNFKLKDALAKINPDGTDIEVVGSTYIELDGDVTQFIAEDAPDTLLKAHNDAISAGKDTRTAIANLLGKTLKDALFE